MPSRHVVKPDVADSYYHVYARGRGKQKIFHDDEDHRVFLNLFKRHLSEKTTIGVSGEALINLHGQIELLCYCLMTNHFHLMVFQVEKTSMSHLMKALMTSYTRFYNRKYDSSGALFETTYKASLIDSDVYLRHISRYIHLNPRYWRHYPYSSLKYYSKGSEPEWLRSGRVLELFSSRQDYLKFVADYEGYKLYLKEIKHWLAND